MIYYIYIKYCIFNKVNNYDLNNIIIEYIIIIDHYNLNVCGLVFFLKYLDLEYHLNKCNWMYILPNVLALGIVLERMHLTLTMQ